MAFANSFAIPFEEDERDPKTFFLDLDYVEEMWRMFRKVNGTSVLTILVQIGWLILPKAKERPIGFYHTGPRLRSSDLEITELFKRFCARPVMVIVDVRTSGGRGDTGIPTDAYFAVEEIKDDGTATQRTFTHVSTSIEAEEAEEIGVEHLLRDISSSSSAPSSSLLTTQSLSTRVASQLQSLRGLHARLHEIGEYLEAVRSGKMPVNHQVVYQLQEIMGLLPQLGGDVELGKAFRMGVNDQSLVVFLSSMIRTVLALHDLSTSSALRSDFILVTDEPVTQLKTASKTLNKILRTPSLLLRRLTKLELKRPALRQRMWPRRRRKQKKRKKRRRRRSRVDRPRHLVLKV